MRFVPCCECESFQRIGVSSVTGVIRGCTNPFEACAVWLASSVADGVPKCPGFQPHARTGRMSLPMAPRSDDQPLVRVSARSNDADAS